MKNVHCLLGEEKVLIHINHDDSVGQVMEKVLQLSSKNEQNVIPRLHDSQGFLLPIGPNIEENTQENLYKLSFVQCN